MAASSRAGAGGLSDGGTTSGPAAMARMCTSAPPFPASAARPSNCEGSTASAISTTEPGTPACCRRRLASATAAAAASPGGKDGASAQAPEKVSILGIGGKKKKDSGKDGAGGKKRTPGEIRIQKGEAAFDATKCTLRASIFMYECVGLQRLSFLCLAGTPQALPADGVTCYVSCSEPGTPGGNF